LKYGHPNVGYTDYPILTRQILIINTYYLYIVTGD